MIKVLMTPRITSVVLPLAALAAYAPQSPLPILDAPRRAEMGPGCRAPDGGDDDRSGRQHNHPRAPRRAPRAGQHWLRRDRRTSQRDGARAARGSASGNRLWDDGDEQLLREVNPYPGFSGRPVVNRPRFPGGSNS